MIIYNYHILFPRFRDAFEVVPGSLDVSQDQQQSAWVLWRSVSADLRSHQPAIATVFETFADTTMPLPGHGCDGCDACDACDGCDGCHGCHGCHEHFNSFLHFFSSWSRCKLASLQSLQCLQVANPLRGRTRNGWSCLAQSRRGAARPEIHMNSPCSTCHSTHYTLRNGPFIPI